MSMNDTVSDMLTRIRNGQKTKLLTVSMPYSKLCLSIANVLHDEGYLDSVNVLDDLRFKSIQIVLKYSEEGVAGITEIVRVSRPGRRVYSSTSGLKGYYNNMGIYVLSTSRGVLSDSDARKLGVGGELICKVF